jgi:hypothetical protein
LTGIGEFGGFEEIGGGRDPQGFEKLIPDEQSIPQWLKPTLKKPSYRSGEPLRHPKSNPEASFTAASWG